MRIEKKIIKELYLEKLKGSEYFVILGYQNLKVGEMQVMRDKLSELSSNVMIVKNQVLRHALEDMEISGSERLLDGQNAMVTGSDIARVVQELVRMSEDMQAIDIKGGYLGKSALDTEDLKAISKLPPREVLLGMFCGAMNGAVSGFVNTLSGIMRDFAGTMNAIAEKKKENN